MELKKTLLSLGLIATACNIPTELEPNSSNSVGDYMSFGVSYETVIDTKTQLKEDLSVEWEDGDAVAVFDDECRLWEMSDIVVNPGNRKVAHFSGECKRNSSYWYAVYPMTSAKSMDQSGHITAALSDSQIARAGSFATSTNLAVSYT